MSKDWKEKLEYEIEYGQTSYPEWIFLVGDASATKEIESFGKVATVVLPEGMRSKNFLSVVAGQLGVPDSQKLDPVTAQSAIVRQLRDWGVRMVAIGNADAIASLKRKWPNGGRVIGREGHTILSEIKQIGERAKMPFVFFGSRETFDFFCDHPFYPRKCRYLFNIEKHARANAEQKH